MQLLRLNKILGILLLQTTLLIAINAKEETFRLPYKDGTLTISLNGTKTKFSKIKKIINSESKLFSDISIDESLILLKKILQDTGLFDSVKVALIKNQDAVITIEDSYTLLPIINFSTNLENFSYTIGASESNLFNDVWYIAGAWSESSSASSISFGTGVSYPTDYIQSIGLSGYDGDSYFYYQKKWYQFEVEDISLTINFKKIVNESKFNYGFQARYTQFEFLDHMTLSGSAFMRYGKIYRNHDVSEGYQFSMNFRYLDDRYNKYTFNAGFQKNWYIPFQNHTLFRGLQLDYQIDYSNIEEGQRSVGVYFSSRSGALHGLRSNSIFERNFGSTGVRIGVTSQKFLWTYWQPHIFAEAGLSDQERFYSVGGGLLLTFPALYNSRLRIQYYQGEMPDSISGIIISTTLDF
jgi:hypothetical protein